MIQVHNFIVTERAEYAYILLHHEPSMLTICYRRSECPLIIFNALAKYAYNLLPQNRVSAYTICYRMRWVRLHFVKWAEYAYNLLLHALSTLTFC
jgi:hypothetical protein